MGRNKNKQVAGISWKTVLGILGSIAVLVGSIVSGLDFVTYLREGYQQFLWLGLVVLGVIWLIILGLLLKQRSVYGILWLMVTIIAGVVVWNGWHSYIQTREDKLVVLVAKFDGPEEVYGLRNEILERLSADFANDTDIEIESVNEVITPEGDSASSRAVQLGRKLQADIVVWGWYRPTNNPNITIHIENLTSGSLPLLPPSEVMQPATTLEELESFTFQQRLGEELSASLSFLTGYIELQDDNYEAAITRFNEALGNINDKPQIIENPGEIYYYRAKAHALRGNYEAAIQDLNKAIDADSDNTDLYQIRGLLYVDAQEYNLAIQDFSKAIEIEPGNFLFYSLRAMTYQKTGRVDLSLQDYDKVIAVEPKNPNLYWMRAQFYEDLEQYERAIQDYSKAIEIEPSGYFYVSRGALYKKLGQIDPAVQDYNMAVQTDSKDDYFYVARGDLYMELKQYDLAIQDYTRALKLNPNNFYVYESRGRAYQAVGKAKKAEADFKKYIKYLERIR